MIVIVAYSPEVPSSAFTANTKMCVLVLSVKSWVECMDADRRAFVQSCAWRGAGVTIIINAVAMHVLRRQGSDYVHTYTCTSVCPHGC
jgi:hypothetical protein